MLQADVDACHHEADKKGENEKSDVHSEAPCVDTTFIATTAALQAEKRGDRQHGC